MLSKMRVQPPVPFPVFSGAQVYMRQATGRTLATIELPEGYHDTIRTMLNDAKIDQDLPFFITIDERVVKAGEAHRRGGAHIDGNFIYEWGGGGGNGWLNGVPGRVLTPEQHKIQYQSEFGGTLIAASHTGAVAWLGEFEGIPGQGGDCEHLRDQFGKMVCVDMGGGFTFLMNSTCIHQSMPMEEDTPRQLLRLTLDHSYSMP